MMNGGDRVFLEVSKDDEDDLLFDGKDAGSFEVFAAMDGLVRKETPRFREK
jgi:hypothetical protein